MRRNGCVEKFHDGKLSPMKLPDSGTMTSSKALSKLAVIERVAASQYTIEMVPYTMKEITIRIQILHHGNEMLKN